MLPTSSNLILLNHVFLKKLSMVAISELKNLTVPELKKALLERGLNVVGKKQDLINRLTTHLQEEEAQKQKVADAPTPAPAKEVEKPAPKSVKTAKAETKTGEAADSAKENVCFPFYHLYFFYFPPPQFIVQG